MVPTVAWKDGAVRLLDQSRLPEFVEFLDCRDYQTVADAMGVALGAQTVTACDYESFAKSVLVICDHLAATRPTAVNLFWAIERMKRLLASLSAQPIASGQTVLTHCNAGALATAGYGTALGVIRAAWEQGKKIQVIADETRPVLQGARLTAHGLGADAGQDSRDAHHRQYGRHTRSTKSCKVSPRFSHLNLGSGWFPASRIGSDESTFQPERSPSSSHPDLL